MPSLQTAVRQLEESGEAPAIVRIPIEIGCARWTPGIPSSFRRLALRCGMDAASTTTRTRYPVIELTVEASGPADAAARLAREVRDIVSDFGT